MFIEFLYFFVFSCRKVVKLFQWLVGRWPSLSVETIELNSSYSSSTLNTRSPDKMLALLRWNLTWPINRTKWKFFSFFFWFRFYVFWRSLICHSDYSFVSFILLCQYDFQLKLSFCVSLHRQRSALICQPFSTLSLFIFNLRHLRET